jgi:hypothetical protein
MPCNEVFSAAFTLAVCARIVSGQGLHVRWAHLAGAGVDVPEDRPAQGIRVKDQSPGHINLDTIGDHAEPRTPRLPAISACIRVAVGSH